MSESNIHSGGMKGFPLRPGYGSKVLYELPDENREAYPSAAKDTKRWCRGHVGVEHEAVWQHRFDGFGRNGNIDHQVKKCVNCGRELKYRSIRSDQPPSSQPEAGLQYKRFMGYI